MPKNLKDKESIKKRALRILGSRNMSAGDMEQRLVSKGELPEDAAETVKWLEDMGAINDKEYASLIVRHYCAKGYGPARVRDELYKRKIPRELWDEALGEADNEDTADAALEFLNKKLRGSTEKDDLRKAGDALIRRGFSYEESRTAVKKYTEASEDDEIQ